MKHWFDEFSTQLATGKLSRRTLISGIAATVGAAATIVPWEAALAGTGLCLSGQRTTRGKCCTAGTACGTACCAWGCANNVRSQCKPRVICFAYQYVCTSRMRNSNATQKVCCTRGSQCYNGRCCAPGKVVCASKRTGAFGCWSSSECQTPRNSGS